MDTTARETFAPVTDSELDAWEAGARTEGGRSAPNGTREAVLRLIAEVRRLRALQRTEPEHGPGGERPARDRVVGVAAAFGAFADLPTRVDDYLHEKHAEAAREKERLERMRTANTP
jgi:hypothetical protein